MMTTCERCNKCFSTHARLLAHNRREHQDKAACRVPGVESGSYTKVVVLRANGVFKCPNCDVTFQDPKHLRSHTLKSCQVGMKAPVQVSDLNIAADIVLAAGLEYNSTVGLLICSMCRYSVLPEVCQVVGHFQRKHKVHLSEVLVQTKLAPLRIASPQDLEKYTLPSNELLEAIRGISVKVGVRCSECAYYATAKRTMIKHFKATHHSESNLKPIPCHVQSIYGGLNTKYFGVLVENENGTSEAGDAVAAVIHKFTEVDDPIAPSDDRLLSSFLRHLKWHEIVASSCTKDLRLLRQTVRFDVESTTVQVIFPVICRYWKIGQDLIGNEAYLFEQILSSTTNEVVHTTEIRRIQETSERYCKTMAAVLSMVIIHSCDGCLVDKSLVNPAIADRIKDLVLARQQRCERLVFNQLTDDNIPSDHLQLLDDILEVVFRVNMDEEHCPSEFHAFPTHRFIICRSIRDDTTDDNGYAQFLNPKNITSMIAELKYWARLSALMTLHQRSWGVEPTERNAATVSRANALAFFLKEGHRTPFSLLDQVLSLASSIALAPEQRRMPQVVLLPEEDEAIMEGGSLKLEELMNYANGLIDQFHDELVSNVLMGFNVLPVQKLLQSPSVNCHDNFSRDKCGYSFLEDHRNPWKEKRMELVGHFLSTHRKKFIKGISGMDVEFDIDVLFKWCQQVDKLTKMLLPLIYTTSGQPYRASEMSSTLLRNSVAGERSLYMLIDRVMIVQRYHKGSSKSQQHKLISRFLPRRFTLDFVVYIALVRPAYEFFLANLPSTLAPADSRNAPHYYLFSTLRQRPLNADGCRAAINDSFTRARLQLSVHQYRHIAITFVEKKIKPFVVARDRFNMQAAHSSLTASTAYSRTAEDPYFMTRDDLLEYLSCSKQWHQLLHLEDPNAGSTNITSTFRSGAGSAVPLQSHEEDTQQSVTNQVARTMLAPQRYVVLPPLAETTTDEAIRRLKPVHFSWARTVLRNFLANPRADFRSKDQCIAATLVMQSVTNLLVVMATNGGKSLLYQLASFVDPKRTVIVVIPLVALMIDSVAKTTALGIQCDSFGPDTNAFENVPSVLFVGVDYLETESFRIYLATLHKQQQVSKIFFDEAHLVLTASDYRPCMKAVNILATISVQKILLTATLPPRWENMLSSRFGFPFVTLRAPTTRKQLRYSVEDVLPAVGMEMTCLKLSGRAMNHPDKVIVFVLTQKEVDKLAKFLSAHTGRHVERYHSGISVEERKTRLARWKSAGCSVIVATCGLGQGVDYPSVRLVIHMGLPRSLMDYVQETGRAGRDGKGADCIIIYDARYCSRFQQMILRSDSGNSHASDIAQVIQFIKDKENCRRQVLQEITDGAGLPCTLDELNRMCDVCGAAVNGSAYIRHCDERDEVMPTPIVEAQTANDRMLSDKLVYSTLSQRIFSEEPLECLVCLVFDPLRREIHEASQCPRQVNRCFKCLDQNHSAEACENRLQFMSLQRTCYVCGLPLGAMFGGPSLHYGSKTGRECKSKMKERMIPGVWSFFEKTIAEERPSNQIEVNIRGLTKAQFSRWLAEIPSGGDFTNLCILTAYILRPGSLGPR